MTHLTRNHVTRKRRGGIAVVEFLFAAPAFFILVFFVVEIALTWNDRHIMRLAAFRAAKAVVKTRSEQGFDDNNKNLCWTVPGSGAPVDPQSSDVQIRARRAAIKLMATVTPSVTQLLTMFGNPLAGSKVIEDIISNDTVSQFGGVIQNITSNRYVHAFVRMMKGLPAAWLFTDLRCTNITYPQTQTTKETAGIEITLVYHRPPKMPYIGNIMWMLYRLQQYATPGDETAGIIYIDPLNFGVKADFDAGSANGKKILGGVQAQTFKLLADTAASISERLKKGVDDKTQSLGFATPIGSVLGSVGANVFGATAGAGFDEVTKQAANWGTSVLSSGQLGVNFVANAGINLLLSAPDELKTIPIQVTVRIPNVNQAIVNQGKSYYGQAVMVGAMGNGNSKMGKMARKLSEVIDGVAKLPYVKTEKE